MTHDIEPGTLTLIRVVKSGGNHLPYYADLPALVLDNDCLEGFMRVLMPSGAIWLFSRERIRLGVQKLCGM